MRNNTRNADFAERPPLGTLIPPVDGSFYVASRDGVFGRIRAVTGRTYIVYDTPPVLERRLLAEVQDVSLRHGLTTGVVQCLTVQCFFLSDGFVPRNGAGGVSGVASESRSHSCAMLGEVA